MIGTKLMGFLGGFGVLDMILLLIAIVLPVILFLWALVDLIKRPFADSMTKVIWALVILLLPFFGSIIYLVAGRTSERCI